MAEFSLKHKTTVSLFWSFLDKFGQQLINFVSMLVLMNIIAPDAYGMIGSLALFTAFSTILIDSGFGRVLTVSYTHLSGCVATFSRRCR